MADYGEYIGIFSIDHLIYIFGLIVVAAAFFSNTSRVKDRRRTITVVILIVILLQQLLLYGSYYFIVGDETGFDASVSLPLHISRINSLLGILYLLTRNAAVFRVLALFALFAWLSFLYPSQVYGVTHPIGISFFINHVVTLLLPFYGMVAYGKEIKTGDSLKVLPWFVVYLAVAYVTNMLTGGNYFYLQDRPVFEGISDAAYIAASILFAYVLFKAGELMYRKVRPLLD
ncbi:TMEM164-related integral membrane acyltransferase [Salinicoccus halitifaciens]|uniref:Integral membrane protein (TIGR02206 family) n=1 Tax=Salinicoccus halitifaciens TaxID=1073415 RepID=A0ABV2EB53_9STAP|nr:TIGR02206 family membrane protein [Salinicoccus halitifaciens]MCD2137517.1 TIGR02206 family membrane protein [Salinicoccus halitifaciens]